MNKRIKELFRKSFKILPTYITWRKYANGNHDISLDKVLLNAVKHVPYYMQYRDKYEQERSLSVFPTIRKSDILGHEHEMVSNKVCKKMLATVETGGSTGCSLTLFRHWRDNIKETTFINHLFSIIGNNLITGVLRGDKPKTGISEVLLNNLILLSSYDIRTDTIDDYIKVLNEYKVSCIHAYPSSLIILARLIKKKYGTIQLPYLKGILTSSEVFSTEDQKMVQEVFCGITIVDYYGHSEMACCAYNINGGHYHFIENFGHVEFVDTGECINGNRIAEIVATSVMNTTMPLIRYATDDYVELDKDNNVVSIIGRTSDFLVTNTNEITPCIVSTRAESLQNVINFQFFQEKPGLMEFRVVVNDEYCEHNKQYLQEDLEKSFGNSIDCKIVQVSSIERTKAGKQKRLVQKLDIRKYL